MLVALGIVVLAIFVADKLLVAPGPPQTTQLAAVIDHLQRHDVRHVTIPANTVTLEMNDGKRMTANVPADRDLWPLIRGSGADVALVNAGPTTTERSFIGNIFQFVPFVIMALILIFILISTRRRAG